MSKRMVLFVHGLGGSPKATWEEFVNFMKKDEDLSGVHVDFFSYPTFMLRVPFLKKYPGISTLADGLSTQIEHKWADYRDITLVCHSLGGLIGKQYIINRVADRKELRVKRALMFTVPHNGASLASVGDFISWRHPQLRQLCKESDAIKNISISWSRTEAARLVETRYIVGGQDRVVDEHSARGSWENDAVDVLVDRGHIDAVKPVDNEDLCYLILKNALVEKGRTTIELPQKEKSQLAPRTEGHDITAVKVENRDIRVSMSAIIRIEYEGRYLLIRNVHRPEGFGPIGGVYKYRSSGRRALDELSFRPQTSHSDMKNDLRGYLPVENLGSYVDWFRQEKGRETASECLIRELREELDEADLQAIPIPLSISFSRVREIVEGPEYIPALGCEQYRIFEVFDINEEAEGCEDFVKSVIDQSKNSSRLIWVGFDEIRRGRALSGVIIGSHAAYLAGRTRYRDGDPPF